MSKDLFSKSVFTIKFILGKKIISTILANTCAIIYDFPDKQFAEKICQDLKIQPQHLIQSKQIQGFNGRAVQLITHAINSTLTVCTHTEDLTLLLITKLKNHCIILI